jgi:hypothetical protein
MNMIPGMLYISTGDEVLKLGKLIEIEEEIVKEPEETHLKAIHPIEELSVSFKVGGKTAEKMALVFSGLYDAVLSACPNRRVLHLTKNARKERTRKKNLNRIFRMLEKGEENGR